MKKNVYVLTVNYDRSVEDGVVAGKYDWTNSDTTSGHFPSNEIGTKEVSVELVHFGRDMTTDEVLSKLDKTGLRPATLKELLALGEGHPDLQREFPIVALGSVWQDLWQDPFGRRYCAYLHGLVSKRSLSLTWVVSWWRGRCRFAAVRK